MPSVSLLAVWPVTDAGPELGIMGNSSVYKAVVSFTDQQVDKMRQYLQGMKNVNKNCAAGLSAFPAPEFDNWTPRCL